MKRLLLILRLSLCLWPALVSGATLTGRVVAVTDGDTVKVLDADKKQHKIRLNGIDAPESKQAYGSKAKRALSQMVHGKSVKVQYSKKDRYDRILGDIYKGTNWVNLRMVAGGWAWHYKAYSGDDDLAKAEIAAREEKRGLWSDSNSPTPPWDFRKQRRSKAKPSATPTQSTTSTRTTSRSAGKASSSTSVTKTHWLNTGSNVRHNQSCRYYDNTKRGRLCGPNEGKAGGCCGG